MSTDGARLPAPGSASGAASSHALGATSSHALGATSSHALGAGDRLAEAVAVMARIRRDGDWESAQTHASLLPYLVEESWELVDAVADGDRDELVSELGDLLLQVLFHAAIGAERAEGSFDIQDVAGSLLDKLRRRAPYWFDDDKTDKTDNNENDDDDDDDDNYSVTEDGDLIGGTRTAFRVGAHPRVGGMDAAEQDRLWQLAKAAERAHRPSRGVLDGIPWGMPALALGQKALSRALSAGVPDDLIPAQMRIVRVEPAGLFSERGTEAEDDSGSAEVAYRQVVRRFARDLRQAESRLPVPAAEAGPEEWRAAWPTRPS